MKKKISLYNVLFFIIIFTSAQSQSQSFLRTNKQRIVNDRNENILLRGEGLGGWMLQEGYMLGINKDAQQHKIRERLETLMGAKKAAEFYNSWLHNFIQKGDVDSMKTWGFNSIRLPMHYNLYTLPVDKEPVAGNNTWLREGFVLTDSLLKWCKQDHMYLILDLHGAPGGQGNDLNISDRDDTKPSLWQSEANQRKTIALWRKIAERYKDESWIGGYDILNEPNWGFTDTVNDRNGIHEKDNSALKNLYQKITEAIRSVDKNHIIIIEGNGWGNNYNCILPVWDSNMVLSFHKYWDYNKPENIKRILDARDTNNVPVWLGETGENSNVWYTEEIHLLEQNNIGWSMWPLKKMGANNPLQITTDTNYNKVKNYLNGTGAKPKETVAYNAMLTLATYAKIQNNIFHKDVIDAMFRQPFSSKPLPYYVNNLRDSLCIAAADYDLGKNGVAYYDMDTANYSVSGDRNVGNKGYVYRNDGVDIYIDSSKRSNSYYVGSIEDGEWLTYTINVLRSKKYLFIINVRTSSTPGNLSLFSNGKLLLDHIAISAGKHKWQRVPLKEIALDKGLNTLKIYINKGFFDFKNFSFISKN